MKDPFNFYEEPLNIQGFFILKNPHDFCGIITNPKKSIMQFKEGELVLILDTQYKPAGTVRIIGYNKNSTLYAVSFRYPGANTDEEFEIPERRILIHNGFTNPEFAA